MVACASSDSSQRRAGERERNLGEEVVPAVSDARLPHHLDAERLETAGEIEGVRVEARRAEKLAPDREDGRPQALTSSPTWTFRDVSSHSHIFASRVRRAFSRAAVTCRAFSPSR